MVLTGSNSEDDIIDIKKIIANKYPEIADLLIDLNYCEAGGKHSGMYGDNGTSYGGFMFKEATFKQYCKGSRNNFEDQLDCTVAMIKLGYGPLVLGWQNCWYKMNLFKYKL